MVGFDNRFLAEEFAAQAAATLMAQGMKVFPSGTKSLFRLYVEGPDEAFLRMCRQEVEQELGLQRPKTDSTWRGGQSCE